MPSSIYWSPEGVPFSARFNDQYFCKTDGYAEAVHVACDANALRVRFGQLDPAVAGTFVILETGFGTGLDMCCAWELWDQCAPSSWQLYFLSAELFPLSSDDMARALGLWPALTDYARQLLAQYAPGTEGRQQMSFQQGRVRVCVFFEDVVSALRRIKQEALVPQKVDACFLDGFAPSKNPGMWSGDVFRGVAALCREGTTFSTFTVAGHVRRGLEAVGFEVSKVPGHGLKKHILRGVFRCG